MQGMTVVFSGIRDPKLEDIVAVLGGQTKSSVSRQTTLLAVKDLSSHTSKVQKAAEYGIKVQSYYDFRTYVWKLRDSVHRNFSNLSVTNVRA